MIAVKDDNDSLKQIQILYTNGHASKEDYTKALQLYQAYIWVRLRVIRGIKLLQLTRIIDIIRIGRRQSRQKSTSR